MDPELVYHIGGRRVTFRLERDEITIGRSSDNDLVIPDTMVSRHHARIHRKGTAWRVSDLGSSNGTRINDLGHADKNLQHGDRVLLHQFELTFVDPSATAFSLTLPAAPAVPAAGATVFRSATDFTSLASSRSDLRAADKGLDRLLALLTRASATLLSSPTLDAKLESVLELIFEHLDVHRGCILLRDDDDRDFVVRCVRDRGGSSGAASEIRFSRTIAEKVYCDKVAVLTTDAQSDERFAGGASIMSLGIRSAMAAPLWNGDRVEGIIYTDTPMTVRAFDDFDLDLLSALGNHVAVAIQHERLQNSIARQRLLRRRLERYHSPAVVQRIIEQSGSDAEQLVADERHATVLFADVVGFSSRSETMPPRDVAQMLNRYFSEMAEVIFQHDGTLDKFIGDCVMAVFGVPLSSDDHQRRAAEAALDMREALQRVNEPLPAEARVQFRVGMHCGRVIAGDIGSMRRSDYTVLGSTVNLAARLESSVAQPGQIVISDTLCEALAADFETRSVGVFQPKGISRQVPCYELLGRRRPGQAD